MSATKGNGLTAPHDQPAKTNTKSSPNFIATLKEFAAGFYLDKSIDMTFIACALALLVQVVFMALPDVFQSIDWAGLVALGGVLSKPEQLSFLPPPPFNPQWPTKGTLADKALKMLMDGKMIDHPDFENSTQSWRLGAVIFTLRTLGWPVETIEIPSPTEHSPDRVIALYKLDAKYTAQALALNGGCVC